MWLARHRHGGQQAVAGRFANRARQRGARGGEKLRVPGDELYQAAKPVKLHDVGTQHGASKRLAVADAVGPIGLQEKGTVELLRLDLQPDFFFLAVQVEKSRLLLGILHYFGKWLLLARDGSGGRRGSGRGRRGNRGKTRGGGGQCRCGSCAGGGRCVGGGSSRCCVGSNGGRGNGCGVRRR